MKLCMQFANHLAQTKVDGSPIVLSCVVNCSKQPGTISRENICSREELHAITFARKGSVSLLRAHIGDGQEHVETSIFVLSGRSSLVSTEYLMYVHTRCYGRGSPSHSLKIAPGVT